MYGDAQLAWLRCLLSTVTDLQPSLPWASCNTTELVNMILFATAKMAASSVNCRTKLNHHGQHLDLRCTHASAQDIAVLVAIQVDDVTTLMQQHCSIPAVNLVCFFAVGQLATSRSLLSRRVHKSPGSIVF